MKELTVLGLDGVDLGEVVFTARDQFGELLVGFADGAGWRGVEGMLSVWVGWVGDRFDTVGGREAYISPFLPLPP